ncbi:hypothetical protein SUNI508_06373 [Seiridium unicorne]|uniref:Uncharacterized protein n=1 Tax=Seiridium unicorne TaxID=138068 RepID=A0ABR2V0H1_9PEZI
MAPLAHRHGLHPNSDGPELAAAWKHGSVEAHKLQRPSTTMVAHDSRSVAGNDWPRVWRQSNCPAEGRKHLAQSTLYHPDYYTQPCPYRGPHHHISDKLQNVYMSGHALRIRRHARNLVEVQKFGEFMFPNCSFMI